jgi:hypothetical protein
MCSLKPAPGTSCQSSPWSWLGGSDGGRGEDPGAYSISGHQQQARASSASKAACWPKSEPIHALAVNTSVQYLLLYVT